MSLNSAMLAGVSGLTANASAMATISDNISNVNTTAYKRNRTDFTRLVTFKMLQLLIMRVVFLLQHVNLCALKAM